MATVAIYSLEPFIAAEVRIAPSAGFGHRGGQRV